MLAVVLFLLALTSARCDNNTMAAWNKCTEELRDNNQLKPETVKIGDVLRHCHFLRKKVAKCVRENLHMTAEDGSNAARGKVLVDLINMTNGNEEVVQLARYYHYACVYNDIGIWLGNSSCYNNMLQTCVLKDGDCYGLKCHTPDYEMAFKSGRSENTAVVNGLLLPSCFLLTILYLY